MEEHKLVQLSQEGHEEAFGSLVKKYEARVFHMAYSLVRNQETADDLAQEIFVKAYLALPQFKFKSNFGTWLYRIAANHIQDFLRKEKKNKKVPLEETMFRSLQDKGNQKRKQKMIIERQSQLLHQALRLLPPKYQLIISLRDIQGFSYQEITRLLNLSPGTVDSRLHRARKMLRKKIEPLIEIKGEKP